MEQRKVTGWKEMRFTLGQLYKMNESKPYVRVTGIDDEIELQWDYCDLEGMPPKVTGASMHDMGTVSYTHLTLSTKA